MNNRSISRSFAVTLLALATGLSSYAGDIVGRVVDANTEGYLPGVSVKVPGMNRSTTTDDEGRYRIGNLPAGSHTVQAEYIGYDRVTKAITVPEIGSVTNDITLGSEVVELEAYDVEGYREGRSLALQQKRSAGNLMDLISSDSVGNLPDRNVAEALARIPGVSLDVDSGEGRFVSIRGMEPNFNTVTYNGATLAAPTAGGREGRAMPLDVVGSSQITQLEVIKSITPDMDGNSLGGTINIKSASGYDREKRFIFGKFEAGNNSIGDGTIIDTDVTYGDTFNDGKIGLALSANYSNRPYTSWENQMSWSSDDVGYYPTDLELVPITGERTRMGFNYNLEFRPDDTTEIYFFGLYNQFNDERREQEFIIGASRNERLTPTLVNFARARFEQRDFQRETDQTVINATLGMKKRFDNLTVLGDVTYSQAKEDVPFIYSSQFRTSNVDYNGQDGNPPPFQFEFAGFYPAYNDQGAYRSYDVPEAYPLRRNRIEDSYRDETNWTPRLDFTWDYEDLGGYPGTFKVGAKYTTRTRFIDDNSQRPVSASGFSHTMADLITPIGSPFSINDGRYTYPSDMNLTSAHAYVAAHPEEFVIDPLESASNSIEDDYDITEKVAAVYLMGTVDWSEQLHMIYGVRYEKTDADLTAFELQDGSDGIAVVENNSTFSYDNWLPNLQFRYDLTENSVLRFAATATIGRPQYEKAAPISVLEYQDLGDGAIDPNFNYAGSLEIGNPDLLPYESMNLDLAYEYYFKSGAMVSAGLFYKSIDNPIYEYSEEQKNVVYNDYPMETLGISSFRNADSASITGVELNAVLPFTTFISGSFLDGFGVDGNATFIESSVDVIDRESEDLPFFRQPSRIYNLAFYYQKYGFSARIAWNYQDESLRELSGRADRDQWDMIREYTDVQASYRINENFTVYATWKNITDMPKNRSYGRESGRMRRSATYGSDLRAGIRFLF